MNLENDIFKRCFVDYRKLKKYGFRKIKKEYIIEKSLKNIFFKAIITINSKGELKGKIIDSENNEEFLLLRIESAKGAFVAEVKKAYIELLYDIKDNCFTKQYFNNSQTNRIAYRVIEKYHNYPEFLWEKTPTSAVFRNADTKKWYLVILSVDRKKLEADKKGLVEIIDIKLDSKKIDELLKEKHFYPAYHMNKKNWITIILDNSLSDEQILELIEQSYGFSEKK